MLAGGMPPGRKRRQPLHHYQPLFSYPTIMPTTTSTSRRFIFGLPSLMLISLLYLVPNACAQHEEAAATIITLGGPSLLGKRKHMNSLFHAPITPGSFPLNQEGMEDQQTAIESSQPLPPPLSQPSNLEKIVTKEVDKKASETSPSPSDLTYQDIAVAVVTSTAAIQNRLPILQQSWLDNAPFATMVITDQALGDSHLSSSFPGLDIRATRCSPEFNGLICKTRQAFELLGEAYPNKKWYFRVMDDTLLIPPNILYQLGKIDADKPWCVGDKIDMSTEGVDFFYFQGGGGWALSRPALTMVQKNWHVWDSLIFTGGDTPKTPGFLASNSYADDLFWGIFMKNLEIEPLALEGWSGAPVDLRSGIIDCKQEIIKQYCVRQTFPVGHIVNDKGQHGTKVMSSGPCRGNMTRPAVFHMGLEIWGGQDQWVQQMPNVSHAFARDPADLVVTFEDTPFFYWRLCSVSGRSNDVIPQEVTHQDIYVSSRMGKKLHEIYKVDDKFWMVHIGLCQRVADVFTSLPVALQTDEEYQGTLVSSLERLRDNLRYHIRPHLFALTVNLPPNQAGNAGNVMSVQLTQRVGDDPLPQAQLACQALANYTTMDVCVPYAVSTLESRLPSELRYREMCQSSGAYKVDPGQIREISQQELLEVTRSKWSGSMASQGAGGNTSTTTSTTSTSTGSHPASPAPPTSSSEVVSVAPYISKAVDKFESFQSWRLHSLSPSDLAVAILTTSTVLSQRWPILQETWVNDAPFPVILISDDTKTASSSNSPHPPNLQLFQCPSGPVGFACKTGHALQHLYTTYPKAKWYIMVSDSALVSPSNLIHHLRSFDHNKPICLGELNEVNTSPPLNFPHGGSGWALSQAGMKQVLPQILIYMTMADDNYAGGGSLLPEGFQPESPNLFDFYWGVYLQRVGVEVKQAPGWTALPVEVASGLIPCENAYRSLVLSNQLFQVGHNKTAIFRGKSAPRIVEVRPAVFNMVGMVSQPTGWSQDTWATTAILEAAKVLRQYPPDSLAAVFDDHPFLYWRLCALDRKGKDLKAAKVPWHPYSPEVISNIRRSLSQQEVVEDFKTPQKTVKLPVSVCLDPSVSIQQTCNSHGLDIVSCYSLLTALEQRRDQLRSRARPIYFRAHVGGDDESDTKNAIITAAYRLGDDPRIVAETLCRSKGKEGLDCVGRVERDIAKVVPTELQHQAICKGFSLSSSSGSPPVLSFHSTKSKSSPTADTANTTTPKTEASIAASTSPKKPRLVKLSSSSSSVTEPMSPPPPVPTTNPTEDEGDEENYDYDDDDDDFTLNNPDVQHLQQHLREGGMEFQVGFPVAQDEYEPGTFQVASLPVMKPEGPITPLLETRSLAWITKATGGLLRKCLQVDQGPVSCMHVMQTLWAIKVDRSGLHNITIWATDSYTHDKLDYTVKTVSFKVKERSIINPFTKWCTSPLTQRAILLGRLQRRVEDGGHLSFDFPIAEPLEIFFRLSPRLDAPKQGLKVVRASTMGLIKNLREMNVEQRQVTTLRVLINGFSPSVADSWSRWIHHMADPLGLRSVVVDKDVPVGNVPSYLYMKQKALSLEGGDDTIIFFLEDDYLLLPTAIMEMVEVFVSHNPCVVIPYDGGERYNFPAYNDDDGRITMFAGKRRHWRTTRSTTVTFSARLGTMKYIDSQGIMPNPQDDYFNSGKIYDAGASIVLPIPGLGGHIEKIDMLEPFFTPLYFNYMEYARELHKEAQKEGFGKIVKGQVLQV